VIFGLFAVPLTELAFEAAYQSRQWLHFEQCLDNWSLALDWRVLLLTIPKVLTGKGAY